MTINENKTHTPESFIIDQNERCILLLLTGEIITAIYMKNEKNSNVHHHHHQKKNG